MPIFQSVADLLGGHGTTTTATEGVVPVLQSILSGSIPVLLPVVIAVIVLFGGYRVLKGLYHRHF